MSIVRITYARRILSFTLIAILLIEPFFSPSLYALTGGLASPEFSSFEPASTSNMVNEFTGDFTYNLSLLEIPGPEGCGYLISLSYHSGTSPEEEASWVGYGWTLNPGAINRAKRGHADDHNGVNKDVGNLEIFGTITSTDYIERSDYLNLYDDDFVIPEIYSGMLFPIKWMSHLK